MYQYTKRLNCHCKVDYWLHEGKQHGLQDHIDKLMENGNEYDLIILPDSSSNDATYHDMLEEVHTPCLILDHHLTDVKLSDNAVVINNPGGGKVFRQAIFLLKPEITADERELAEEAQRVIEEHTDLRKKGKLYR